MWAPLRKRLVRPPSCAPAQPESGFDAAYGVETAAAVRWLNLQAGTGTDAFAHDYMATPPAVTRLALARLGDVGTATFVDIGCGKGRALILASELPFRAVVGIERTPALIQVARRNAERVASAFPERAPIQLVLGDAADPHWPDGDLVIWLFNPFLRPVMTKFAAALERCVRATRRQVIVLYLNPTCADVLDQCPVLVPDPALSLMVGRDDDWSRPWELAAWRTRAG